MSPHNDFCNATHWIGIIISSLQLLYSMVEFGLIYSIASVVLVQSNMCILNALFDSLIDTRPLVTST